MTIDDPSGPPPSPGQPPTTGPGGPALSGPVESGSWWSWTARPVAGEQGPEWSAWTWTSGGRRGVSWLGVLLVLLGVALLIQQVNPAISFTSLFLLALGLAFGAAWIFGGLRGATVPALVLLALALARLVTELGYVTGDGWTPLFLGVALLIAWLAGLIQHARREWALWLGLILGVYGLAQVWSVIPGLPDLSLLWPVALIVLGLVLLLRRRFA